MQGTENSDPAGETRNPVPHPCDFFISQGWETTDPNRICLSTEFACRSHRSRRPNRLPDRWLGVSLLSQMLTHLRIHIGVVRLPGAKAVDIAVVHAESSRNQNRIVNLDVGSA